MIVTFESLMKHSCGLLLRFAHHKSSVCCYYCPSVFSILSKRTILSFSKFIVLRASRSNCCGIHVCSRSSKNCLQYFPFSNILHASRKFASIEANTSLLDISIRAFRLSVHQFVFACKCTCTVCMLCLGQFSYFLRLSQTLLFTCNS